MGINLYAGWKAGSDLVAAAPFFRLVKGMVDEPGGLPGRDPAVDPRAVELPGLAVAGSWDEAAGRYLPPADQVGDPGRGAPQLLGDVGRADDVGRWRVQPISDALDVAV